MAQRTSAQRKFTRGVEQIKTLSEEAKAFENRHAYVFRAEVESRSANHIKYRCFADEREPPSDEWPLLAGEAIQNLRSCLDHAVYAASKGRKTKTGFPIFTDACEFQVIGSKLIQRVPEAMRTAIEKAQPYNTLPAAPGKATLERLRSLSNLDKHRTLAAVASGVQHEGVGVDEHMTVEWHRIATGRTLGAGETYISSFTVSSETELPEMHVEPIFAYQVRIEGAPIDLLTTIGREVFRVLVELEQGKPLSPYSAYPL